MHREGFMRTADGHPYTVSCLCPVPEGMPERRDAVVCVPYTRLMGPMNNFLDWMAGILYTGTIEIL